MTYLILFLMYENFAHMYVCVPRMCLIPLETRTGASDLLGLKLHMVVSSPVGTVTEPMFSARAVCIFKQ